MTKTATAGDVQLASSAACEVVEGNQYFPPTDVDMTYFKPSAKNTSTHCGWKGDASYYDIHLSDGKVIADGAWYYPKALPKAKNIENFVAFYTAKGIKVA